MNSSSFFDQDSHDNITFLNDITSPPQTNKMNSYLPMENPSTEDCVKVIVITIACSDRMGSLEFGRAWESL